MTRLSNRLSCNLPEELAERLDAYCEENFTTRTEAVKAWIKSLPLEKPMKKKKSIKADLLQT
jgi:metal-responsive CopG/Arc/MetJ family transcriptional regulator